MRRRKRIMRMPEVPLCGGVAKCKRERNGHSRNETAAWRRSGGGEATTGAMRNLQECWRQPGDCRACRVLKPRQRVAKCRPVSAVVAALRVKRAAMSSSCISGTSLILPIHAGAGACYGRGGGHCWRRGVPHRPNGIARRGIGERGEMAISPGK